MESYRYIKIYDANSYFLLTAKTKGSTKYKTLKILKHSDSLELQEDSIGLSREDLNIYLESVLPKERLKPITEANAILGMVRFLQGYYLHCVTQQSKVGTIRAHSVYKIESTKLVKLFPDKTSKEEERYKEIFYNLDLSLGFYFSYTYDLTYTLQENISFRVKEEEKHEGKSLRQRSCTLDSQQLHSQLSNTKHYPWKTMFLWNHEQIQFLGGVLRDKNWLTAVIHGHLAYSRINMGGSVYDLVLVSRRSRYFAGTRYLKRGLNEEGKVANDVETEQLLVERSPYGKMSAYVQLRGSIPLFWCQEPNPVIPPPAIILNQNDFLREGTRKHIADLYHRYGVPIFLLSLLKQNPRQKEYSIATEYLNCVEYLNETLPPKYQLKYIPFDIKNEGRRSYENCVEKLYKIGNECISVTNIYVGVIKSNNKFHCEFQQGVIRTNCIDCIDRTNAAQLYIGHKALERQMAAMGIVDSLDDSCEVLNVLSKQFEEMGDMLALQYSGSEAHRTIKLSRGGKKSSQFFTSLKRHWANLTTDSKKQQAINLFLGVYKPYMSSVPLWDIDDDTRLHNRIDSSKYLNPGSWWKFEVSKFLVRLGLKKQVIEAGTPVTPRKFNFRRSSYSCSDTQVKSLSLQPKKRTKVAPLIKKLLTEPISSKPSYLHEKLSKSFSNTLYIELKEKKPPSKPQTPPKEPPRQTHPTLRKLGPSRQDVKIFQTYISLDFLRKEDDFAQVRCKDLDLLLQENDKAINNYLNKKKSTDWLLSKVPMEKIFRSLLDR